jgi:hypothetical protein
VFGDELDAGTVRRALNEARFALQNHHAAASVLRARRVPVPPTELPAGFEFPGMDLERIPIEPGDSKFETIGDALGWLWTSAIPQLRKPRRQGFVWHDDPRVLSRFRYETGGNLRLALFADFGTGRYHSLYIAKQIVHGGFSHAIHLGDVYYKGTEEEYAKYFEGPLGGGLFGKSLFDDTQFFTLHENHDLLSGSVAYHGFLDRNRKPPKQVQEGSYFRLVADGLQIVGLDTSRTWSERSRHNHPELQGWLRSALDEGKRDGCVNVLLTGSEPYGYGSTETTALLDRDLREFADRGWIDLWFWGNTHYCALFDRTGSTPFFGSCIGHAGYPYGIEHRGRPSPAPVLFLEDEARFPAWTGLRPDRGNNGFATLEAAAGGNIVLRFVDWRARTRCTVTFARKAGGRLEVADIRY